MVQDKIIKKDCITMDLPTNPEYVSVARLTVSAISKQIFQLNIFNIICKQSAISYCITFYGENAQCGMVVTRNIF